MMRSFYCFHAYYQIRRILEEIQAPLPQDDAWDAFDAPHDDRAYGRICSEFGISTRIDWRQTVSENHGLGTPYIKWKGKLLTVKEVSDDMVENGGFPSKLGVSSNEFRKDRMDFVGLTKTFIAFYIDYIDQGEDGAKAWTKFVLDRSEGFTQPGVVRINDSISAYVWAILGAQAQTRTGILGAGTSFDAQKQFLANPEDAISSPVDLPSAIARY